MKSLTLYNPIQMEQIQNFICETFGGGENDRIAHELTSEYVHTDTQIIAPEGCDRVFVTFGMGARKMNAPRPDLCHVELLMSATEDLDPASKEGRTLIAELVALSKFPFRNDTWLHHGHTIEATDAFREAFGFDAFTFMGVETAQIDGIGEVDFLLVIPIYKEEREWMMQTDAFAGYLLIEEICRGEMHHADSRRAPFIPDEQTLRELT